jgi:hypothetical protein
MIRYLTLEDVLELHRLALEQSGGLAGVQELGRLESAVAQPQMTFGGQELYPSLAEKAARWRSHWCAITHSWTETSASDTPRWKRFWCSTAGSCRQVWTNRSN